MTLCAYFERATDGPCSFLYSDGRTCDLPRNAKILKGHDWQGRIVSVCGLPYKPSGGMHHGQDGELLTVNMRDAHEFVPGAVECPKCTGGVVGYHEESDEYESCKPCGGFGVVCEDGSAFR
jgi:hypothetical protein